MKNRKVLTIVGLGLIGGTYAKSLRGEFDKIYAVDKDDIALAFAKREGIIDEGFSEPSIAFSKADLIIICLYPNQILDYIEKYKEYIKEQYCHIFVSGLI